jgi:3-oxoacyl-[acyl-carrier-protein] synthase II
MSTGTVVAVTGLAWSTPLGDGLDEVWQRLLAGECGLRPTTTPQALRSDLAGIVDSVAFDQPVRVRQVALAEQTLREAFRSAGLSTMDDCVRMVCGTSYGPDLDDPSSTLDSWASEAAQRVGHPYPPVVVATACSAGADAIAVGAELVRSGATPVCVAGGVDVVSRAKRLGHSALRTMSPDRLRAFDQRHDGMTLGEGAAFVVLESAESARNRGRPVTEVLAGCGAANDAAGLTAPDPSGTSVVLAVERALRQAGRATGDVGVLNAHATGTPVNDDVEATSLTRLFGPADAPVVFATKGALGHSLGATGAIEAVALILALRHRRVPPIAGLEEPMPGFPLPLAMSRPRGFAGRLGASVTIGFGGFNTCLLFERSTGDE